MTANGDGTLEVVPVRHVGRWVGSAVALLFVAMLVHTLLSRVATGQVRCATIAGVRRCHAVMDWRFGWHEVGQYFTSREIVHGLFLTIEITVIAMVIGICLGVLIAIMRISHSRLLSSTAWTYTWFFRGTPVFVQILFWFNIGYLYHSLTIGLPFLNVTFLHIAVNSTFTPLVSGIVALSLNEGAYMSEIARAGLLAVDEGQIEAATSIGMTRRQTLRLVILPQAMRVILPPTGNEVISMLKTSSLVSSAGVIELLGAASNISAANYETMQLLIVASLWYLIVTTVLSIGQYYLERHFSRGALRTPPPTPMQRLRKDVRGVLAKFRTPRGATLGAAS
jgi:polar amino acid transport system permease protein